MPRRRRDEEVELPTMDYGAQPIPVSRYFEFPEVGIQVLDVPTQQPVLSHGHDFREIVYIARGESDHEVLRLAADGSATRRRGRLVPGDCFAIARGERHAYARTRRFGLYNVLIDDAAAERCAATAEDATVRELLSDAGGADGFHVHLALDERERALAAIEAILDEQARCAPGFRAAMRAQLVLLLVELARAWRRARGERPPAPVPARSVDAIEMARAYLEERLAEPLTLDQVAAHAGLSGGHLSALFRRRFGVAPFEYLATLRIERAKRLLRAGRHPIGEVARAVGFADANYFARAFRAAVGESPRAFARGVG